MSIYEACPYCEELHDLLALEPSFRMPDAYLAIPQAQREFRTMATKDACAIRDMDDSNRRYFLRVLAPFYVQGLPEPISWGVLGRSERARFPARAGAVERARSGGRATIFRHDREQDPTHIPAFNATAPEEHRFVIEQRTGVSTQRVAEWLAPIYHPEALAPKPRSTPQS